ncbi:MAG: hypothetical protein EOM25_12840, partial [Deltaproteobacteria bacterium]|nr:hypothetical protein [Deltaproteobacteria bacterium]
TPNIGHPPQGLTRPGHRQVAALAEFDSGLKPEKGRLISAPERPPCNAAPSGNHLLQFSSNGHILGFAEASLYVAGIDRVLKMDFVGGQPVRPMAEGSGAPAQGTPTLGTVSYFGVWEGVDVVYRASPHGILESFYYLENTQEGTADSIRLRYNRPVSLDGQGNLVTAFESGNMIESAPVAWQEVDGEKRFIHAAFVLSGDQEVGFELGDSLPGIPVVIDPILTWNTFMVSGFTSAYAIAPDDRGNVYVTGYGSWPSGNPVRAYTAQGDAIVVKLNGVTGEHIWHTYLGGHLYDVGNGIAVDQHGEVYVTGTSRATWGSPTRLFTAGYDAFVAVLQGGTGELKWHTFLGGLADDFGSGIAVDGSGNSGNIYVTGTSMGSWHGAGSPASPYIGGDDAFVAAINSDGGLEWHTFVGGVGTDRGTGITVDSEGHVYIAGSSNVSWGTPMRAYSGGWDGFAAMIWWSTGDRMWHTFLGGSYSDLATAIATDNNRYIYVTGSSDATWGSPVRPHSGSPHVNSRYDDAFAAKIDASLGSLEWNTFLGGDGENHDYGQGIAVRADGHVYVAGHSTITWGNPIRAFSGMKDGFAAWLNTVTGDLEWNTFLGGIEDDEAEAIAVDGFVGNWINVYVAGSSKASWGNPVHSFSGSQMAFAARHSMIGSNQLNVNVTGAASAEIAGNPSTYGGWADYVRTGIPIGTRITLTAPSISGTSLFTSWTGCDSTDQSAGTCTVTILNSETTVTAHYSNQAIPWKTEIGVINYGPHGMTGTLHGFNATGGQVWSRNVMLDSRARMELDVTTVAGSAASLIKTMRLDITDGQAVGYQKLYQAGKYRVGLEASPLANQTSLYVPHIASNDAWWTGIGWTNTTYGSKNLQFSFDNGASAAKSLAGNGHDSFTIASLFDGKPQPGIGAAKVSDGAGMVGLMVFGGKNSNILSGISLSDATTNVLHFPHVAHDKEWWTGVVVYNPGTETADLSLAFRDKDGQVLGTDVAQAGPGQKMIGTPATLNFPAGTAWFTIESTQPVTGFELFGMNKGNQLAGYSVVKLATTQGVFPKLERHGWTGIAFVNIEDAPAVITLEAWRDNGNQISANVLNLGANSKVVAAPKDLFAGMDINAATYLRFWSDKALVGFQLNGSLDGTMLDAIPALGSEMHVGASSLYFPHIVAE